MIRCKKSKRGFTLIEMVLVIAIIVILAAVLFLSITGYISRAHKAASMILQHNDSISSITAYINDPNAI